MSDIERLLARFETGAMLRPSATLPNIVDLSRALASLIGSGEFASTAHSTGIAQLIGQADHLVFILADGLGMNLLEGLPKSACLSAHFRRELRTIFPSTTAVVLTSIATGEWPNRHGVTGEWTHLPELQAAATLLPFTKRSDGKSLTRYGITAEQAFPLPPVLHTANRDVLALFPTQLVNSVSSTYFSGYRAKRGYKTLSEAADVITARVASSGWPTFTYLYTPRIDLEAHRHGAGHPHVKAAVVELDRQLERIADGLGSSGRVVLTADHGLLDAPVAARNWIKPSADLFESLLFPPSGDARVMYLHLRDGAEERVRLRLKERYGDRFLIISTEEAERVELFGPGPISPQVRSRLGDMVVVSSGEDVLKYVPSESVGHALTPISYHSGLSPAEMRIPLIVA